MVFFIIENNINDLTIEFYSIQFFKFSCANHNFLIKNSAYNPKI